MTIIERALLTILAVVTIYLGMIRIPDYTHKIFGRITTQLHSAGGNTQGAESEGVRATPIGKERRNY